jgi:hypothetical protein
LGECGAVEALVDRMHAAASARDGAGESAQRGGTVEVVEALLALCWLSHANRRRLTTARGLAALAEALALPGGNVRR